MERWTNRVAIVTGAGSGLGASTARLFAENGLNVVAADIDLASVQKLECETKGHKGKVHPIQCDVSKEEDVVRVVKWTRDNLGGADVLVNCAGLCSFFDLSDANAEQIRKIFEVNVLGTSLFIREIVRDMHDRHVNDGHIFNLCSVTGQSIVNYPGISTYAGSKHAIRVMSEYLRRELRDKGTKIKVTNISPGLVRTNIMVGGGMTEEQSEQMFAENPTLQPVDVANAILYALSTPPHVQVHEITIRPLGEIY